MNISSAQLPNAQIISVEIGQSIYQSIIPL